MTNNKISIHPLKISCLLFLITFTLKLYSQPWLQEPWLRNTSRSSEPGFYEMKDAFQRYWKGKTPEKGKGYKQFLRWMDFWEPRVYPSGNFPDPGQQWKEKVNWERIHPNTSRSTNGNWTSLGPSQFTANGRKYGYGRVNCVVADPANSSVLFAGTPAGGLWKSTDGGGTWSTNTDKQVVLGVSSIAIDPTNSDIIYIATGDGDGNDTYSIGVLKSTNGGLTWNTTGLNWNVTQTKNISKILIHPTNPAILVAATSTGIYKTSNSGNTWTLSTSGNFKDIEFQPGQPSIVYAGGDEFYKSNNTGTSFTKITSGLPSSSLVSRIAIGVTPADASYVYLLVSDASNGFQGTYKSTDAGATFTQQALSPNILGWETDGSDTGGQGWYDLSIAVSPTNKDIVFTGGVNIWKSTDGCTTFNISAYWNYSFTYPYVHADIHALDFIGNTLYAGCDGGVFKTTDNGTTWTDKSEGLQIHQIYRFGTSVTNSSLLIVGAQDNGSSRLNAGVWENVMGADGMECLIDYSDPDIMYATIYNGDLSKSTDGGNSFYNINGDITEYGGWVTPFIIHPTNPQILYAGYENIWKSTDRGESWTKISSFSGGSTQKTMAISQSNPNTIYTISTYELNRTTDGGTTWSDLSGSIPSGAGALTYIAVHPTNSNTIVITSSGYSNGQKVYKSINGGSTWTNISGTLPNVPANCVTYENTLTEGLFVGTDLGVFYRNNNLTDWIAFNDGLPNVVVNEMEIHSATQKIRAATYGRGVWESDLYSSNDTTIPFCTATTILTAVSDSLDDQSGNNNYKNKSNCSWLIVPDNAFKVTLKFISFNTQQDKDFVKIYDGDSNTSPLLAEYSGAALPDSVTSSAGKLFVEFITDDSIVSSGWSAFYTIKLPPAYPVPVYTTGTGDGDYLDGIKLGSINTLGNGFTTDSSYTNNTFLTARLFSGNVYALSFKNGINYEGTIAGWIDYDQDIVFNDSTEKIFEKTVVAGQTDSIMLSVPPSVKLGKTRLRVMEVYQQTNLTAAGTGYGYGETEDYSVEFIKDTFYITTDSNKTLCLGGKDTLRVSVTGGGPFSFSWNPGGIYAAGILPVAPVRTTIYSVVITDSMNMKKDSARILVYVYPKSKADFSFTSACVGDTTHFSNLTVTDAVSCSPDLFFSEYIEGTSNNKAIEIYNNTGATVNLSGYKILIYNNGNATPSSQISIPDYLLPDNGTYTICHPLADSLLKTLAQLTTTQLIFTGNDALALVSPAGYTLDIFGKIGQDPGTEWISGNVTSKDKTLTRKAEIIHGVLNNPDVFDISLEWVASPMDDFTTLGFHTIYCGNQPEDVRWDFGDGTVITDNSVSLSHFYGSSKLYNASLTVTVPGGCGSQKARQVNIINKPTVNAGEDTTACEGKPLSLLATGSASSYSWWGDNTLSCSSCSTTTVSPVSQTMYYVKGTKTGCFRIDSVLVSISLMPKTGFSYTIQGRTISLVNFSENGTGWLWNFGDSATSTEFSPVHDYLNDGKYTLWQYVSNNCGTDSLSDTTVIIYTSLGKQPENGSGFSVYPNPASGFLYFHFYGNENIPEKLTIRNVTGQVMLKDEEIKSNTIFISLLNIPTGVYDLELEVRGKIIHKLVVIQK